MRNNILPTDFASNVMPTDENGKPIVTFNTATPYVKAVLHYLQEHRISLNTADFVDAIIQSMDIKLGGLVDCGLSLALYRALIVEHYSPTDAECAIYHDVIGWLDEQDFSFETFCHYQAIVTADYPMPSTLNPKKIAIWRSTSKMGDWDRRQAVSVRKWIGSTLTDLTAEQAESLAKRIDERLAPFIELDVRHHSSYDFEDWERAYTSEKIRSCMHPDSSCAVGYKRTFTCYCSGYHGLPDNGLSLTVLYKDGTPVARSITFCDDDGHNCYIRAYGDDRLENWLINNGYKQSDFAVGTILYTTEDLLKPYVDGDVTMTDHYTTNDGKHYWVLASEGEYNLQTTDAYASYKIECECCGASYSESSIVEVYSIVNGCYYTVCSSCEERNSYYIRQGMHLR